MAHTPGPWEAVTEDDIDVRVCRVIDGKCVCCVALMGDYNYDSGEWTPETVEEWKANAHLIAVALDLLAVCRKLVECAYFQPVHPDQWACHVCHHWHWRKEDIIHSDWCPVPQAEAVLIKVSGG